MPQSERTGIGLYGVWTGDTWRTLDRKSLGTGSFLSNLPERLAEPVDALDLLVFSGLFAHWDSPPIRTLVCTRDFVVTRASSRTAPRTGAPAAYDSLDTEDFAALCDPSARPSGAAGVWHVRVHAQSGTEIFLGEWDVHPDFTVEVRRWDAVVTGVPVDEILQSRTPPSVGEIQAAVHMESMRNYMPRRLGPKGLREWIGVARWFFWDVLMMVLVGIPLLVAMLVTRWALSLVIAPALIVAGRPEHLLENIPLRLRSTRPQRLATCIGWTGILAAMLVFGGERVAFAAAGVLGATVLLASIAFAWNEAERYRLARTLRRDDGLLARLPDRAVEFSLLTLLAIAILPLALHRIGLAFPGLLPGLGPSIGSSCRFIGTAIVLGSPPAALLRDLGVAIPVVEAVGSAGRLAGRVGLGVNLFVFTLLIERVSMRRLLRSEAMTRLNEYRSVSAAVALGMYASRPLRRAMEKSRDEEIRGRAAMGLALIGDRGSLPLIDRLLAAEQGTPFGRTLAVSASLLGRPHVPDSAGSVVVDGLELNMKEDVNLWSAAVALLDPAARPERTADLRHLLAIPNASVDLKWEAAMALASVPDVWTVDDVLSWTALFVSDEWSGLVTSRLMRLGYLLNCRDFWYVFDRLAECIAGAGPLDRTRASRLFVAWMRDRLWYCGDDGAATLVVSEIQRFAARTFSAFPPSATTARAKARWLRSAVLGAFSIGSCAIVIMGLDAVKPQRKAAVLAQG